jgi:threonine dehydrogenase-like Zn-dependent dehydrogenase
MDVAVLAGPGRFEHARLPIPRVGPGDVLVRVEGCGVCASSLPLWEGRPWFDYPLAPGAPGHEAWGIEVESRRRVALLSYNGFAEYEVVAEDALVPLPPELAEEPFPGEALGCAMNVFRRSGVGGGDTVAVVGAGFLGLLLVQLCVARGATVLAFARREHARELARAFGAETPAEPPREACDVAIETGGAQATLDLASSLVRTRGRLVVAGFHQDGSRLIDLQSWNWRGLDVINAHERSEKASLQGIRLAARAVLDGTLRPGPLYSHVFPLTRLDDAFETARRRPEGFLKALVLA